MERNPEHPTLLDGAACDLGEPRRMAVLDQCERLIPWDELGRSVAHVFPRDAGDNPDRGGRPAKGEPSRGGRPHWPVKLYVKCLMLRKWFNLSDPQLEEPLRDRIRMELRGVAQLGYSVRTSTMLSA